MEALARYVSSRIDTFSTADEALSLSSRFDQSVTQGPFSILIQPRLQTDHLRSPRYERFRFRHALLLPSTFSLTRRFLTQAVCWRGAHLPVM